MVRTWLLDKTGSVPSSSARGAALDRYICFFPTSPSLIWNTCRLWRKRKKRKKGGKESVGYPPHHSQTRAALLLPNFPIFQWEREGESWSDGTSSKRRIIFWLRATVATNVLKTFSIWEFVESSFCLWERGGREEENGKKLKILGLKLHVFQVLEGKLCPSSSSTKVLLCIF